MCSFYTDQIGIRKLCGLFFSLDLVYSGNVGGCAHQSGYDGKVLSKKKLFQFPRWSKCIVLPFPNSLLYVYF